MANVYVKMGARSSTTCEYVVLVKDHRVVYEIRSRHVSSPAVETCDALIVLCVCVNVADDDTCVCAPLSQKFNHKHIVFLCLRNIVLYIKTVHEMGSHTL